MCDVVCVRWAKWADGGPKWPIWGALMVKMLTDHKRGVKMSERNEIVKVYSHRRSGTNILCALLYVNYYKADYTDMWGPTDMDQRKMFYDEEGQPHARCKWADIFGSHDTFPVDSKNAIYIKRNPLNTAKSLYRFYKNLHRIPGHTSFKEWEKNGHIIRGIKKHHEQAQKLDIYTVTYEELTKDQIGTLEHIQDHFKLKPIHDQLKPIRSKVGWNPGRNAPNQP
jgi:hypothetical protein